MKMTDMNEADRRLVLCEDDPDTLDGLTFLLTEAGFTVAGYLNAEEALPAIIDDAPLAVITDLDMPGMTGEELCERIRQTYTCEELLVIAISGRTRHSLNQSPTQFNSRLQKPIDLTELLHLISSTEDDLSSGPSNRQAGGRFS